MQSLCRLVSLAVSPVLSALYPLMRDVMEVFIENTKILMNTFLLRIYQLFDRLTVVGKSKIN